jgi:hypothetical protein
MTKEKSRRYARAAGRPRRMILGQEAYLNRDTQCGLFEASNGNRYLVTWDYDIKIAIALSHRHLPAFTGQGLAHQPLEHGQWWGPARLRLTHPVVGGYFRKRPGVIGFEENFGHVWCRSGRRGGIATSLGYVHAKGLRDTRHFKGWSLEPLEIQYPFFVRFPNGETSLASEHLNTHLCKNDVLEVVLNPDFIPGS